VLLNYVHHAVSTAMPRRHVTTSPKTHADAYPTKVGALADQKPRRDTAASDVTGHSKDAHTRKSAYLSQSDKRTPESGNQRSLRQALKLYQTEDRSSSRKRKKAAAVDNSSVSSERSDKSSNSGTSSSSAAIPTMKGSRQTQHRVTYDALAAQRASVRGEAEHQNSPAPAEPNAGGTGQRSVSPESSHMSISSSGSQAEAPSATARATKRPGRNTTEVHSSAKKRLGDNAAEVGAAVEEPPQKSSSASHRPRSSAALDKTVTGVERQHVSTANDKDLLTAARPMDRYERVERYLEHSNMPPIPPTNVDDKTQQSRHHRRQKYSSRATGSLDDPARKAMMAAVRAAMPAKLRREALAQSNSENESDNGQNDMKEDVARKQHKRSKRRRHRSPPDHLVKYSFPPFDEPAPAEKKRKRRGRRRYESSSSSGSSSSKDSGSENATPSPPPPPPPQRARRKRPEKVEQQRPQQQRRHHTVSESSSGGSSASGGQPPNGRQQQTAAPVVRAGSMDSVMPVRNHKFPKPIERNSLVASKRSPDIGGRGQRSRNQGRTVAVTKTAEIAPDQNDNMIKEADKDQWRKYFADLYTFNMLQKMKSAKKSKSKRRRDDDMDIDNDDDNGVERQNAFHPAPPDAIHGDTKAIKFDGGGHSAMAANSTTNYDASHRVPFGDGSVSNIMPGDLSSASRGLPPTSYHDREIAAAYNSWPGMVAKPGTTSTVDEISGRQTLLPLPVPSEPVPLFSLNLSGVMPSVSRRLSSTHHYHRRRTRGREGWAAGGHSPLP